MQNKGPHFTAWGICLNGATKRDLERQVQANSTQNYEGGQAGCCCPPTSLLSPTLSSLVCFSPPTWLSEFPAEALMIMVMFAEQNIYSIYIYVLSVQFLWRTLRHWAYHVGMFFIPDTVCGNHVWGFLGSSLGVGSAFCSWILFQMFLPLLCTRHPWPLPGTGTSIWLSGSSSSPAGKCVHA